MKESTFTGVGGLKIFTRSWQPEGKARGAVVIVPALEPRVQKEQHEGEDRDVRPGERIRAGDVNCGKILSHQNAPILMTRAALWRVFDER